jgi:hypothetical protein
MKVGKIALLLTILMLCGTCAYALTSLSCNTGARYEFNIGTQTVTDCRTGLVWLQDAKCTVTLNGIANPDGYLAWQDAKKWVLGLQQGKCGLNDQSAAGDWRLPTKTELMAMVQNARNQGFMNPSLTNDLGTLKWSSGAGSSFTNVQASYYWSFTTDESLSTSAFYVELFYGNPGSYDKSTPSYIWPVRGGQSGSFGSLRIQ